MEYRTRLAKALRQAARNSSSVVTAEEAVRRTELVLAVSGEASHSRQMAYKIGVSFLMHERPRLLVPVCPDYSHAEGRYTFKALGSSVPLLAQAHISFLEKLEERGIQVNATFLIADQEAFDPHLRACVGVSFEEFQTRVIASAQALRTTISYKEWGVRLMTEEIPNLIEEEQRVGEQIEADHTLAARIMSETVSRASMYCRINPSFTREEMRARTIRTASQYYVLGTHAVQNHALICNHTTVNLAWYKEAKVGILHNPISVY